MYKTGNKTYSTPYLGQAAMDRAAQEQRERERVQREERAARMGSLFASDGSRKWGERNGVRDTSGDWVLAV